MALNPQQLKELITSTETDEIQTFLPLICASLSREECEKAFSSVINNSLSGTNRYKGFLLLENTLSHLSESTFIENGNNWCSHCIGKNSNDTLRHKKLSILEKILEMTVKCDQFNKKFLSEHMSDLLKMILGSNSSHSMILIRCLSLCMPRFPAWFGNHRDKIEPFLLQYLENSNPKLVEVAAIAFHYFQQTGNAGADGVNYSNNFLNQSKRLCATIHALYDELLNQFKEITDFERVDCDSFNLLSSNSNYVDWKYVELVSKEVENCLVFLQTMVREPFSAQKFVVMKYFVDIVHRGLSFHECASENLPLGKKFLFVRFYNIQIELLELLRLLSIGFFTGLRPFNFIICKTLLNSLKRASTCDCFPVKYQETSYKVTIKWILSGGFFNPKQTEALFSILIGNMRPKKKEVTLSLTQNKKKSKKSAPIMPITKKCEASSKEISTRSTICHYSLKTLKELCNCSFITIKREQLKDCVHLCVKLIAEVQTNRALSPYDEEICQVSLYELLVAFLNQESSRYLIPMNLVVGLLDGGLHSERPNIAEACRKGLSVTEVICQPLCAPLGFEKRDERNLENSSSSADIAVKAPEITATSTPSESEDEEEEKGEKKVVESEEEKAVENEKEKDEERMDEAEIEGEPSVASLELDDDDYVDDSEGALEIVEYSSSNDDIDVISIDNSEEKEAATDENVIVEEAEEPPAKRQKPEEEPAEDDNNLSDMLASFQDVVQE